MFPANVHSEYIAILKKIKMNKEILDEDTSELNNIIETSNTLLNKIENTADLKIDAKISSIYSEVYLKLFQRNLIGRGISIDGFITFLNSPHSHKWFKTLLAASKSLRFVSFIDFNYSVINKERKYARLKMEIKDIETPIENEKVSEEVKSSFILNILDKLKHNQHLPYYRTVLDGDSFTNTIENIFHLSLSIRSKDVMLIVVDDIVYITQYKESNNVYNEHIVEELDYSRFLQLKRDYLFKEEH